jgi:hypothetical protein
MTPTLTAGRVLRHLLGLQRPHGSSEEGSVIPYLLTQFAGLPSWIDGAGNLHVDGRTNHRHRTLFVGHTDTVHRSGGVNQYREDAIGIHAAGGVPLGADDAAGVSILAAMIGTVPGYYIFTRGEECGGLGSSFLADNYPELLAEFDRAIAFDRRGTGDVITHQARGRCASDEFAWALADALNGAGLMYAPSDAGIYTDTAEFTGLIPECTNLSVGYYAEHSAKEWLDTAHHAALLRAALGINWDALPVVRDPAAGWHQDGEEPPITCERDATIKDAIGEALDGNYGDLLDLIAARIDAKDPASIRRHLDPKSIGEVELIAAMEENRDWDMVLEHLTSEAFVPF